MKIGGSRSLKVGSRRTSCSPSSSVSAAKLLRSSTGVGVDREVGLAVLLGEENSSSSSLEGSGWDSWSLEGSASDSVGELGLSDGVVGLDSDRRANRSANLCMNSTLVERTIAPFGVACRARESESSFFPFFASSQGRFCSRRLARDIMLEAAALALGFGDVSS